LSTDKKIIKTQPRVTQLTENAKLVTKNLNLDENFYLRFIRKPKDLRLTENKRKKEGKMEREICVGVFETNLLGAPKAQSGEHHSLE